MIGEGPMQPVIPLGQMSTSEKLRALEEIWEDLLKSPETIPSPSWHADVLAAREERLGKGTSQLKDWTEAKRSIRDRTR
jgi:hypothetical protein